MNPESWASLTGPGVATVGAIIFMWAIATERLVPGRRYRASEERGDKYEASYHEATKALIESAASNMTTTQIMSSFRKEIAELAAHREVT